MVEAALGPINYSGFPLRHQPLRIAAPDRVENGSLFVPYLMAVMDKMKGMGRNGPWIGGYVSGRPSDIVKQHVFVSPYHEEDIVALAQNIGTSQVLFGSDYPYRTGEDHVKGIIDYGFSQADLDAIGRGNAQRLMPQWKS